MSLGNRQRVFARMVADLIIWAYDHGYEVTFGDAFRDPRAFGGLGFVKAYGHPMSYHKERLAIDLNLFKDGRYLTRTEDHRPLGEYWKSIGGTWGGDFPKPDGNHYSYGEARI